MLVYAARNKTIEAEGERVSVKHKWTSKEILVALCPGASVVFHAGCVLEMDYNEGRLATNKHTDPLFFGGAGSSGVGPGL